MALCTLQDIPCVHATISVPAWGVWYADVELDRDKALSGLVTLAVGKTLFLGTIVSGGVHLGKAKYRVAGGAGGWGKTIAAKGYANDLGVKASLVLTDAAKECGETVVVTNDYALGYAYARKEGRASAVLQTFFPAGWHVDENGITRTSRRAASTTTRKLTVSNVDQAYGRVELRGEDISDLRPGLQLPEGEALDVTHEITPDTVRTTITLARVGALDVGSAVRALVSQTTPRDALLGDYEYRVVNITGNRMNLQRVSSAMGAPDLLRVPYRSGGLGVGGEPVGGARCVVRFVDSNPGKPYVAAWEERDGDGFTASRIDLLAGGQVAEEHLATIEGVCLLIYNTLVALMTAAGGGPLVAAALQPLIGAAINTALAAQAAPAPSGLAAQNAAATAQLAGFGTGVAPATTSAFFSAAIAGVSAKTPNVSGKFPSLGTKAIKGG